MIRERERQLGTIQNQAMPKLFPLLPLRKEGANPKPVNIFKKHPTLVLFGFLPSNVASQLSLSTTSMALCRTEVFFNDNWRPCSMRKLLVSSKYCSTLAKLYGEDYYNLKKLLLFRNVPYMNNITAFPKQHKMTFPIEHYLPNASQPMFLDHSLNMQHVAQHTLSSCRIIVLPRLGFNLTPLWKLDIFLKF